MDVSVVNDDITPTPAAIIIISDKTESLRLTISVKVEHYSRRRNVVIPVFHDRIFAAFGTLVIFLSSALLVFSM